MDTLSLFLMAGNAAAAVGLEKDVTYRGRQISSQALFSR